MASEVSQSTYKLNRLVLGSTYRISIRTVNEEFESSETTIEYTHFLPPTEVLDFGED